VKEAAGLQEAARLARTVGRGDLSPFSEADVQRRSPRSSRPLAPGRRTPDGPGEPVRCSGGRVELARRHGARRVVLQVLHEGDVFGDIPFLCEMPPLCSARALTDITYLKIGGDDLLRIIRINPHVCHRLLFRLASRLQRMQRRLIEMTRSDLRTQVAALLLDQTEGHAVEVALSQRVIVELLGATRQRVNQVLRAFQDEGVVSLFYGRVDVLDPEGLGTT